MGKGGMGKREKRKGKGEREMGKGEEVLSFLAPRFFFIAMLSSYHPSTQNSATAL